MGRVLILNQAVIYLLSVGLTASLPSGAKLKSEWLFDKIMMLGFIAPTEPMPKRLKRLKKKITISNQAYLPSAGLTASMLLKVEPN